MSIEAMKQALEALESLEPTGEDINWKWVDAAKSLRQAIEQAEKHETVAAKKDAVFDASIQFIGTLTGMKPPPIETSPPEIFKPFRDFTEKVCLIFTTTPQPQQAEKKEPTYYLSHDGHLMTPSRAKFLGFPSDCMTALYTTPQPKHEWVGLTPDDFRQLEKENTVCGLQGDYCPTWDLIEATEARLKERNHVS